MYDSSWYPYGEPNAWSSGFLVKGYSEIVQKPTALDIQCCMHLIDKQCWQTIT